MPYSLNTPDGVSKKQTNEFGLTYADWLGAATMHAPAQQTTRRKLIKAWRNGEDPTEWNHHFCKLRDKAAHAKREFKLFMDNSRVVYDWLVQLRDENDHVHTSLQRGADQLQRHTLKHAKLDGHFPDGVPSIFTELSAYLNYLKTWLEDNPPLKSGDVNVDVRYEVRRNTNNESVERYRVVEISSDGTETLAHAKTNGFVWRYTAEEFARRKQNIARNASRFPGNK